MAIPESIAAILTTNLRARPLMYADGQLIPYESFSSRRSDGASQFDVNITYPLDVTSKRTVSARPARSAKTVAEAQFQDAIRIEIDKLYTAFVNVLEAQEKVHRGRESQAFRYRNLKASQARSEKETGERTQFRSGLISYQRARRTLLKAEEDLGRTRRALAQMLDLPPDEANRLEVERSPRLPSIPALADLIPLALKARPDLTALRLGLARAQADVNLTTTNMAVGSEIYSLYQPYTFQGRHAGSYNPLGLNVPLPIYKRDQGNLARARINLSQTQIQLATTERQIVLQVEQSHRECESSLAELPRLVKERDAALLARDLAERSL